MKTFTLKDIKEFCKAHYDEYLKEGSLTIIFVFISGDYVRRVSFSDMVVSEPYFHGVWVYDGCIEPGVNNHIFNFKRIA